MAVTTAAGLRPGWGVYEVASPHALAHHDLARLMETSSVVESGTRPTTETLSTPTSLISQSKSTKHRATEQRSDDTSGSAQLELAAEQTIEAAAAALLWTGEDSHGVLGRVAGASAARMAESRCAYALFRAARREVAAKDQQAFDEDLGNWVVAGSFEVAALPAVASPRWAESVAAALCRGRRLDQQF